MLKVKTFNNGCIKIDEDGSLHVLNINNSSHDVDLSLQQYRSVLSIVESFNIQPERSKREDKCKEDIDDRHNCAWGDPCRDINHGCGKHLMRCSEHCGNTVRDK